MNKQKKAINLQLFADGGATAGAGATGTSGEMAQGENSFNALPTPDKAKSKKELVTLYGKQETEINNKKEKSSRLSFEELIKGEYAEDAQKYIDKAFSKRFAKFKGIEDENQKMKSILEMNNARYNLDSSSDTYLDDYAKAVENDTKLYEEEAMEAGMPVDEYMKLKQAEHIIAKNKADEQQRAEQERLNRHFQSLNEQAQEMKTKIPSFDLQTEMQNEQFKKLVAPFEYGGSNLSVENAFHLIHKNEIMQATVNNAIEQASLATANAMTKNKSRPTENGLSGTAVTIVKDDPSKLTREDFSRIREEFRRTGKRPKF